MRRVVPLAFLAWAGFAHAEPTADTTTPEAHLAARRETLTRQEAAATALARKQAWVTYRLARRKSLGFFAAPERRREDAEAVAWAATTLARTLDEARTVAAERKRVEVEQAAVAARERADAPPATRPTLRLAWPVRGTLVATPGPREDAVTGVAFRDEGISILARFQDAVRAPAVGRVRHVDVLPQGGYAVVIEHGEDVATIIGGLREVAVGVGAEVELGAELGRIGRTLDGAPVVTFHAAHGRALVDPRTLLAGKAAPLERAPRR